MDVLAKLTVYTCCPISPRSTLLLPLPGLRVTRFSSNSKQIFFFSVSISQALDGTYLSHRWFLFDLKLKIWLGVLWFIWGSTVWHITEWSLGEYLMFWGWLLHRTLTEHLLCTRLWQVILISQYIWISFQIIMLYTLNSHNVICQWSLHKAGKKILNMVRKNHPFSNPSY